VGITMFRLMAGWPPGGRTSVTVPAVGKAVVTAAEPFPVEVDGEALPARTSLLVESVPEALTVVA
jgi:diacylglycerol kinase family enzyme